MDREWKEQEIDEVWVNFPQYIYTASNSNSRRIVWTQPGLVCDMKEQILQPEKRVLEKGKK